MTREELYAKLDAIPEVEPDEWDDFMTAEIDRLKLEEAEERARKRERRLKNPLTAWVYRLADRRVL